MKVAFEGRWFRFLFTTDPPDGEPEHPDLGCAVLDLAEWHPISLRLPDREEMRSHAPRQPVPTWWFDR